jgi:hypothetical protein
VAERTNSAVSPVTRGSPGRRRCSSGYRLRICLPAPTSPRWPRTWCSRANPVPEVDLEAPRVRAVVVTGRSDFPNQINNVLRFPIFRGLGRAQPPDHTGDPAGGGPALAAAVSTTSSTRTTSCRASSPRSGPVAAVWRGRGSNDGRMSTGLTGRFLPHPAGRPELPADRGAHPRPRRDAPWGYGEPAHDDRRARCRAVGRADHAPGACSRAARRLTARWSGRHHRRRRPGAGGAGQRVESAPDSSHGAPGTAGDSARPAGGVTAVPRQPAIRSSRDEETSSAGAGQGRISSSTTPAADPGRRDELAADLRWLRGPGLRAAGGRDRRGCLAWWSTPSSVTRSSRNPRTSGGAVLPATR